jgi:hypothetical protein
MMTTVEWARMDSALDDVDFYEREGEPLLTRVKRAVVSNTEQDVAHLHMAALYRVPRGDRDLWECGLNLSLAPNQPIAGGRHRSRAETRRLLRSYIETGTSVSVMANELGVSERHVRGFIRSRRDLADRLDKT